MALLFDGCIKSIQVVVFSSDNIGITTCWHCTPSNFIMCSDFIPHPYLVSFLFILYPLLFNSKNFFLFSSIIIIHALKTDVNMLVLIDARCALDHGISVHICSDHTQ